MRCRLSNVMRGALCMMLRVSACWAALDSPSNANVELPTYAPNSSEVGQENCELHSVTHSLQDNAMCTQQC